MSDNTVVVSPLFGLSFRDLRQANERLDRAAAHAVREGAGDA